MRTVHEPFIYWYDLENDKIRINCDDDLKFFLQESKIQKLIFEFEKTEVARKRSSEHSGEFSDSSKRLRKRMEKIDLSSDSSIEISSEDEIIQEPQSQVQEVTDENIQENENQNVSSTIIDNEPNVRIISVDVIKPASEQSAAEDVVEVPSSNADVEITQEPSAANQQETPEQAVPISSKNDKNQKETNKIVISDSEEDEDESSRRGRGGFANRNYSSAYSFADINGERFDSRASFDDDFRRYRYLKDSNFQ